MFFDKKLHRLISFFLSFSLLFQSFAPAIIYAEEATQSADVSTVTPTPTPTDTPTPTPIEKPTPTPTPDATLTQELTATPTVEITVTPDATSSPEPTLELTQDSSPAPPSDSPIVYPDPQVAESSAQLVVQEPKPVEKVTLADGQTIVDTIDTDWNIDETNGSAETKGAVKLGVKYIFPLENKVTLTFKSLPADESLRTTLKIVKVKVSDLNLPDDVKPYGEYAYDITTGMTNGTFDYDLTLPKPDNQSVDIVYMEDQNSTPTSLADNQTSQEGDTIKANDLNHFTIFVVVNPTPSGALCVDAGATTGTGCYSTIQAAIDAASNGDTIEIEGDISVGQQVNVNKDVTIDGNGFTVSPTFTKTSNSNNSTFGIHSSGVTLQNITIDGTAGTNLHGINIYMVNNVLLDNVDVLNNDYAGIVVNGSIVTVNNILTAGNGWGGINVDQGTGVTTEAKLIINGLSSHNELAHIWLDNFNNASVDDTHPPQYDITNGSGTLRIYTLKASTSSNPSASLEQCRNGAAGSPNDCSSLGGSAGWVNGNAGSSNSHYVEGLSIPYRTIMEDLPLNTSITLTLEYDIRHSGAHAIDFLTHYNRLQPHSPFGHTAETIDPTSGVSGLSATVSTFAIPTPSSAGSPVAGQPTSSFDSLPSSEKLITLFGGTITHIAYVAQGTLTDSTSSTSVAITFTADSANAVLAWGGHIAKELDWGTNQSAGGINGSPYHMRLINWTLGSLGNQDRSLSAGAVAAPSSITIVKDAQPDNSQDFAFTTTGNGLSNFTLDDDGGADSTFSNSVTFNSLLVGTFTVAETLADGWTLSSKTCVSDGTGSTNSPIANGVSISLVAGENVTCTFTNTQQQAHLTLVKTLTIDNGGSAAVTDWTLDANGPTPISGTSGSGAVTNAAVNSGIYTLSESGGPSGYAAGAWSCTGGTQDGSQITLAAAQSATCTINNDDDAAHLIVIKHVVNDNGGSAAAANFTISITGVTATGGNSFAGAENPGTDKMLTTVGSYNIGETGPSGYIATYSTDCTGTIALGETKTCTITNDDVQPKLTVTKVVTNNNGGAKVVSDFPLFVDATSVTSGAQNGFNAGTYTISETQASGYTSVISGNCAPNGSITLASGDVKSCTITNDDIAPILTLIKTVINDDGGPKVVSDFVLKIDGNSVTSGQANTISAGVHQASEVSLFGYAPSIWTGDCDSTGSITLQPGDNKTCYITNDDIAPTLIFTKLVSNLYGGVLGASSFPLYINNISVTSGQLNTLFAGFFTLTEDQQSGYESLGFSGDCSIGGTITLNPGDNKTCTLTNRDIQPRLTVVKRIVNDNGGTAVISDFPLFVGSVGVTSGVTNGFSAGSYTVSETNKTGYTASFGGDCNSVGIVNLSVGDNKTCTITNDDDVAHLIVIKQVVGSNDSPATFNLHISGTAGSANFAGAGDPGVDTTLGAGTYVVSEDAATGYDTTYSADCTDSLVNGQTKTCTVTNTKRGHIIIQKNAVPDSSQVFGFTNNFGNNNPSTFNLTDDSTVGLPSYDAEVLPGTYQVSEGGVSGWQLESTTCSDGSLVSAIDISPGETVTCTFTNEKLAKITLVKNTVGGNGTFDFVLTGDGLPASSQITTASNTGNQVFAGLDPDNTYSIAENIPVGWDLTDSNCTGTNNTPSSITPIAGEEITCTYTNTKYGSIQGRKYNDANGNGNMELTDAFLNGWTIRLYNSDWQKQAEVITSNTGQTGQYRFDNLLPGTYNTCEILQDGWQQTGPLLGSNPADYQGNQVGNSVAVDNLSGINGEGNICWQSTVNGDNLGWVGFGNFQLGKVSGYKWNDLNGNGVWDKDTQDDIPDEPALEGWTIYLGGQETETNDDGYYEFTGLTAGSDTLSEDLQDGWQQTKAPDSPVNITSGLDLKDQNFGNRGALSITACKYEDSDGFGDSGTLTPLGGWGMTLDDNDQEDTDEETGCATFSNLTPGNYTVTEDTPDDWFSADGTDGSQTVELTDEDVTVDFYNYRLASISGYKWNDVNGNGERDCTFNDETEGTKCEELLGDWTIFLDENGNEQLDEEESTITEENAGSDNFGRYSFRDLLPGEYAICEVQQSGWTQTFPINQIFNDEDEEPSLTYCHKITISSGGDLTDQNFGNQYVPPRLTLAKTNDASDDRTPGGSVTFTLTLNVLGNGVSDAKVIDLPAKGFKYRPNSWIVFSNLQGFMTIIQPEYNSPGDWNLGNLAVGEVVTMSYIADIDSAQTPGLYNDLAWANGQGVGGPVTAVGSDGAFVGTEVNVIKNTQDTPTREVEQKVEGQVLGATTTLPATGADTRWLYLAIILGLLGTTATSAGIILKRKHD